MLTKDSPVMKICKFCGLYKDGKCGISKTEKQAMNECDVNMGSSRKGFIFKGGIVTKENDV